jgi:phenylacetate-CoA ligase
MRISPFILKNFILPVVSKFTSSTFWYDYKKMMCTEELTFDELKQYQFGKLKEILNYANENVPFYNKRFNDFGFKPNELNQNVNALPIPPTTKEDVMSNFPEGITAQGLDRSRWKYVASSGTTRQIMGIHDFRKTNLNWAAGLRAHKLSGNHDINKKWMEIPPHMCTNICGVNDSRNAEPFWSRKLLDSLLKGDFKETGKHIHEYFYSKRQDIYRRITLPSFGSEGANIPEKDIEGYIEKIRDYQPHLLEGLPLYLYTFAKYILNKDISAPNVGVIKPFGGSMSKVMADTIRNAFNCDVHDTYGCSETGFIASDCEKHEGNHLFMDLYYVEVCRNGKLVAPGELGRIYITDLENHAMPWIRYDIGDVGRYFVDDHGCGRKSIRLQIEGRVQDTILNSKGEFFTSDQLFDFFHGFKDIDNFQLIEKSKGNFDLLYVSRNGDDINTKWITEKFKNFFDPDISVKEYRVKTIKAEEGGKFRFVKSNGQDEI